jgi:hypothetical protein
MFRPSEHLWATLSGSVLLCPALAARPTMDARFSTLQGRSLMRFAKPGTAPITQICLLTLLVFMVGCGGNNSSTPPPPPPPPPAMLAVTSVSSTSPSPLTPLLIHTTGLNVGAPVSVQFSNTSGFSLTEQPARVGADGTVVAGIPIVADQTTGQTMQATVSLVLSQGSQSSAPITINIQQLPPISTYGTQLGQISHAVLVMDAMLVGRKIGQLRAFQALPGNTVDTSKAQATLSALLTAIIQARSDVDRVMLNNSLVIPGGNLASGATVQFDATSLDIMDRVLAVFLTQTFANLSPTVSPASKRSKQSSSHSLQTAASSQTVQTLLQQLQTSSEVTGIEANALTAQNSCNSNPATTACLVDAASVIGAVGGAYANQLVAMAGKTPGNTLLGAAAGIAASLNTIGSAFGDLAAFANGLASGNQAILNAAVTDMNNATPKLYGALIGLLQTTAIGDLALVKPVLAGSSAILNYIQISDQQSQGLQDVNSTTTDLTNLYKAPLPSNQGIGTATGIANISPNTPGIASPQTGLELCCFGSNSLGLITVADPSGNYELFIPLQAVGTNYSNVTLTAFDPLTSNTLAQETVDVSALTSATPIQLPPIPSASGPPPLTIPPGQSLSGCVDSTGGAVNAQTLVAFGGAPLSGYTWTLANLSVFPPGTTVDPLTGVFHSNGGTIVAGTYNFTMNVTDGTSIATGTFGLTVDSSSACGIEVFEQSSLTTITLPQATPGSGYGAGLFVGGGNPPYSWALATGSSLPPGLVIDAARGVVRGTPLSSTAGQLFSFMIQVTDSTKQVAVCPNGGVCPVYQIQVAGNPTNATLSITLNGTGTGTVTSSPGGISCQPSCAASFQIGTHVALTASPASGSTFAGWSGVCTGTGSCSITMSTNQSVTATFNGQGPPPVSVTVAPTTANVLLGNTQQFGATVSGTTNTAVTWSVNGISGGNSTIGTISTAGLYTAPRDLPNAATGTVTATSQADANARGNAAVTVMSDISIALGSTPPNPQTLKVGASLLLTTTILSAGNPDKSVQWSVNGVADGNSTVGTIAITGPNTATYTAPATLPSPNNISVVATSIADPSKSASLSFLVILDVTGSWTGTATNPACSGSPFQWLANLTQSGSTVTGTVVVAQGGGSQFFNVTGTMNTSTLTITGPSQIPTSLTGTVTPNGSVLSWSGTFTVVSPNLLSCGSGTQQGTFQGTGGLPLSPPTSANVTGSWTGTATNPACSGATFQWLANLTQSGSTVTGTVVVAQGGGSQSFDVTGMLSGSTLWIAGPNQIPTSFTGVVTPNGSALAWSGTFIVSSPNLLSCGSTVISQGTFQGTGGLPSSPPTSANVTGSWTGTATNPACSAATFQWQASLNQSGATVTGTLAVQESGGSQGPFNVTGTLSGSTLWIAGPNQIPTSFTGIVTPNGSLLSWSGNFIVASPNLLSCGSAIISQGTFQGVN